MNRRSIYLMYFTCNSREQETTTRKTGETVLKIVVQIEFLGMQRMITKTSVIGMPITEKTRVKDALEYVRRQFPALNLDVETTLVTVNHNKASLNMILRANDLVSFLPHIGGG